MRGSSVVLGLALVAWGGAALAQAIPPGPPPALAPAQRNPIEQLAPPSQPRLAPGIEGPPITARTGPGAATEVRLGAIAVTGNTGLSDRILAPAIQGLAGSTVTLARVEEARLAVLRAYRERGFAFTSVDAGLTPRPDGTADLQIAVTEGFVAEVKLDGDIGRAGTQVLRFLEQLVGKRPVSNAEIERALLLASDVPGVTVRGTLRPLPSERGALMLVAQLERKSWNAFATVDNRGYRLVGPWQWLGVVGANSFTEFGERTEISYFGAQETSQWFVQGSVEAFIGGSGLRGRIYGGGGQTTPLGALRGIGYFGTAEVGGAILSYPVVRSRAANLTLSASLDAFEGTVETGRGPARTRASRDSVRVFRIGYDGQVLEARLLPFLPAATTTAGIRLHQGLLGLGATRTGDPNTGRAGNEGFGFTKATAEVQRTQPIFAPFDGGMVNLQGYAYGQWTEDVLPLSEKCYLGGARLGRGFYAGQITGDQCWGFAAELQLDTAHDLPFTPPGLTSNRLTAQFYVFRDMGWTFERLPTDPDRRISSWGGGVRTVLSDTIYMDVEGVHRETRRPESYQADRLKDTAIYFRTLVRF